MSGQSTLIRHSSLLNRLVFEQNTTAEFGRVEVVWMHPPANRVLGFVCKTGVLGQHKYAFNLSQVYKVGAQGIVVQSRPVKTDAEQVSVLETLIGLELWSDAGDKLGKLTDCLFDLDTGEITEYLFRSDGWRGLTSGVYRLPVYHIVRFGKRRVLASDTGTQNLSFYEEGIEQKLTQAGESLREEISDRVKERYPDVAQDWRTLSQQAQNLTKQTKQQLQGLTEQATQKAKTFVEQVNEEAPEEMKQQGRVWLGKLQKRAQHLGEEVKSDLLPLAEKVKEKLQTRQRKMPPQKARNSDHDFRDIPPDDRIR